MQIAISYYLFRIASVTNTNMNLGWHESKRSVGVNMQGHEQWDILHKSNMFSGDVWNIFCKSDLYEGKRNTKIEYECKFDMETE